MPCCFCVCGSLSFCFSLVYCLYMSFPFVSIYFFKTATQSNNSQDFWCVVDNSTPQTSSDLIIRFECVITSSTQILQEPAGLSLTAFLGSFHTELLCSVAAAQVLQLVHVGCVKVDLQAKSGSWRRGEMSLSA